MLIYLPIMWGRIYNGFIKPGLSLPGVFITKNPPSQVSETVSSYCEANSNLLTADQKELLNKISQRTKAETKLPQMKSSTLQTHFLKLLMKLINAKKVLEIGTFTGMSTYAMASALPDDPESQITTIDIDEKFPEIGKQEWQGTPEANKIKTLTGNAVELMDSMPEQSYDMVFIDADKEDYPNLWQKALRLTRPGGLIVVDNTLWAGTALFPVIESSRKIDQFNKLAAQEKSVDIVSLPLFDGLTIARKKS